jgi:hypothetical protein
VARSEHHDHIVWDARREGCTNTHSKFVPAVKIPKTANRNRADLLSIRAEERLESRLAAAGTAGLVYVATTEFNHLWQMGILPPQPVEIVRSEL